MPRLQPRTLSTTRRVSSWLCCATAPERRCCGCATALSRPRRKSSYPAGGELLTGPDLAPNLADALLATLRPD